MTKRIVARARVQVTVEMAVGDGWGADCSISQVQKQAADSALQALRTGLIIDYLRAWHQRATQHATIVGEPKVTAILVDDELAKTPAPIEPTTAPKLLQLKNDLADPQKDAWLTARSLGQEILLSLDFSPAAAATGFSEDQHADLGNRVIEGLKELGLL